MNAKFNGYTYTLTFLHLSAIVLVENKEASIEWLHSSQKGSGLGDDFLQLVRIWAKRQGVSQLFLCVEKELEYHERLLQFYVRNGFTVLEEKQDFYELSMEV